MGAYSEIDIDRRYGGNPFEESGAPAQNIPAFAEEPLTAPPAPLPAVTAEGSQTEPGTTLTPPAQEAGTVLTETPNDAGKPAEAAEDTATEDEKKKPTMRLRPSVRLSLTPGRRQRRPPNRNSLTAWPP